jgi:hypothetical protein
LRYARTNELSTHWSGHVCGLGCHNHLVASWTCRAGPVRSYRVENVKPGDWPLNRRRPFSEPLSYEAISEMVLDLEIASPVPEWNPIFDERGQIPGRKRKNHRGR